MNSNSNNGYGRGSAGFYNAGNSSNPSSFRPGGGYQQGHGMRHQSGVMGMRNGANSFKGRYIDEDFSYSGGRGARGGMGSLGYRGGYAGGQTNRSRDNAERSGYSAYD